MGRPQGITTLLIELDSYYYYVPWSYKYWPQATYVGPSVLVSGQKSCKTDYSLLRTALIAGDTAQHDSTIGDLRSAVWNGNIAYATGIRYDTSYHAYWGIALTVLDTALNVLIPQRRLKFVPEGGLWTWPMLEGISPLGERLAIFYSQWDTGQGPHRIRAGALLLDKNGQVLMDTAIIPYNFQTRIVVPFPGKKCMLWGGSSHILLDSNLTVLDTFEEKPIYMPSGPYRGTFPDEGDEIALPSGTLIKGGEYTIMQGPTNLGQATTALCRLSAATRYASDTTVLFINGDYEDPEGGNSYQNLQYNNFDNRIYYANSSRQVNGGYTCLDSGNNYVQVICTDTLLRTIWRKFISFGPYICATANWVAASDGRGGVGVMGYQHDMRYDFYDSLHAGSFLFHLDSTGNVSVANGAKPSVRDRLKIYPNPATDAVVIDDILGGLSGFALYDMSGKSVSIGKATGKLARASLEGLPTGPYILRVLLSDGSAISETVLKR